MLFSWTKRRVSLRTVTIMQYVGSYFSQPYSMRERPRRSKTLPANPHSAEIQCRPQQAGAVSGNRTPVHDNRLQSSCTACTQYLSADEGFLCDNSTVLRDTIKGTTCGMKLNAMITRQDRQCTYTVRSAFA